MTPDDDDRVWAGAVDAYRRAADRAPPPAPSLDDALVRAAAVRRARNARRAALWVIPVAAAAALAVALWPATTPVLPPPVEETTFPAATPVAPVPVRPGRVVETTASEAEISEAGVASVVAAPHTRVTVADREGGGTALDLDTGRIDARVDPQPAERPFEVTTPYATVRVVGTRFAVEHTPGVATRVLGFEGIVAVISREGRELGRVRAGQTARVGPAVAGWFELERTGVEVAAAATPAGHPIPAIVPVARAAADVPPDPVRTARALLQERRDGQAIAAILAALPRAGADRARLLALLGDAYRLGGRAGEAGGAYEAAIAEGGAAAPDGWFADLAAVRDASGRGADACATWTRYLAARPQGRYAGAALARLADAADQAGRTDEALALRQRVVREAGASPEAPASFARAGKALLDRGDLEAAGAWFRAGRSDARREVAEAALVGLMRVAAQQGREDEVAALRAEYGRRFPDGARRGEVDHL